MNCARSDAKPAHRPAMTNPGSRGMKISPSFLKGLVLDVDAPLEPMPATLELILLELVLLEPILLEPESKLFI